LITVIVKNIVEHMLGKPKDWRRIAACYDRCAQTFMSAVCTAAFVTFQP